MRNLNIKYDDFTDVLYVNLENLKATETLIDENHISVRRREGRIVGITIEGYRDRIETGGWRDSFIEGYVDSSVLAFFPKF